MGDIQNLYPFNLEYCHSMGFEIMMATCNNSFLCFHYINNIMFFIKEWLLESDGPKFESWYHHLPELLIIEKSHVFQPVFSSVPHVVPMRTTSK